MGSMRSIQQPWHAKVTELTQKPSAIRWGGLQQHIGRLQVTMQDTRWVQILHACKMQSERHQDESCGSKQPQLLGEMQKQCAAHKACCRTLLWSTDDFRNSIQACWMPQPHAASGLGAPDCSRSCRRSPWRSTEDMRQWQAGLPRVGQPLTWGDVLQAGDDDAQLGEAARALQAARPQRVCQGALLRVLHQAPRLQQPRHPGAQPRPLSTAGPLMGQKEPHALGEALRINRLRSSGSSEPSFLAMAQADAQLKET